MGLVRRVAYGYGRWNRRRKARFAIGFAERLGARSALLVGVSGARNPVNNLIEHELVSCLGEVVVSGITEDAEGWNPFVVADGRSLPFRDNAFDLVYANAVIEHVGGSADQKKFVDELARVGRSWIITTPNRWFPIEAHHHTLFSHWLPGWAPRGTVTRLLGVHGFGRLLPYGRVRGIPLVSPTLTAYGVDSRPGAATSHRGTAGSDRIYVDLPPSCDA